MPGPLAAAALAAVIGCASAQEPDPAPSPEPDPVSPALAEAVFDSAWSMVYRTYYDTTFAGVDWLALREELRPVARNAGTTDSLRS
ncbi:MAG: peptidase S41, partial [Gemmatimonadota bacterium]